MKVKIKDYDYEIIEVGRDSNLLKQEEGKITFGQTDFENQKIYLNKDISSIRLRKTLIHELTHAFLEAYGFSERIFNKEELCLFNESYMEDIMQIVDKYFCKIATTLDMFPQNVVKAINEAQKDVGKVGIEI